MPGHITPATISSCFNAFIFSHRAVLEVDIVVMLQARIHDGDWQRSRHMTCNIVVC